MSRPYRTDICYLATHGFSARMLMQTGLLRGLAARGLRVALLVPDADDPTLAPLRRLDGLEIRSVSAQLGPAQRQWTTMRKYCLQDIRDNPALLEKYHYGVHPDQPASIRARARLGLALSKLVPKRRRLAAFLRECDTRWLRDDPAERVLDEVDPAVVVATYPMLAPEAQVLLGAHHQARCSVIHLLSWDNITCKGVFPAVADRYIAWGPIMRDELAEHYGVSPDRVCITGVPHFDLHASVRDEPGTSGEFARAFGLDPNRPTVFLTMSAPRFAPREIEIVERLAEAAAREDATFQLLVRPHPQNLTGVYFEEDWVQRLEAVDELANCCVNYPAIHRDARLTWSMQEHDMRFLSLALKHSTVALNSGSTVTIESLYFGRPVILTAFDADESRPYWYSVRRLLDFTHLRKLIGLGAVTVARDFAGLFAAIELYLTRPEHLQAERREALRAEVGDTAGEATTRVIEELARIRTSVNEGDR